MTLFAVSFRRKANQIFCSLEWLEIGKVDTTGTKAFSLLDLIPIENLQPKIGMDTRRLAIDNSKHRCTSGHNRRRWTYDCDLEGLIPLGSKSLLFRLRLEDLLVVEREDNVRVRLATTVHSADLVAVLQLYAKNALI